MLRSPREADGIRINAYLAQSGLGSRRSVEALITGGSVTLNGKTVISLSQRVNPGHDVVVCDGRKIQARAFEYIMLHKPPGFASTRHDPHAKKTIYDLLPPAWHPLNYAGRLDMESEGLMLLSNDGAWIASITHPRHKIVKTYEVEVEGFPKTESLESAQRGIRNRGEVLTFASARILTTRSRSTRLLIHLNEGRNREIRRVFKVLGHRVIWLKRIAIGRVQLGLLKKGMSRPLTREEICSLAGD